MLDDDIQYLGTKPAQKAFSNVDPILQSPRIVTGIILHVEKSADDPACVLTFHRDDSSVVHIGRRPSNEEKVQSDTGSAMFRCAVVSRRHAKIAFSDTGHVYVMDMNSHHGTHILTFGEALSRLLKSETPTKLNDGDVLTFGKSVGRHNEYVRPVVARVELIHGTTSNNTIQPQSKQDNHVDLTRSTPPRSGSGRYGVYVAQSPSSDNLSSSQVSDNYSDIEEISASGPNALPLQPRGSRNSDSDSHVDSALETLKRLLPPVHLPGASPSSNDSLPDAFGHSPIWHMSPVMLDSYPVFNSPPYSPQSPQLSPDWPGSPHLGSLSESFTTTSRLIPLRTSSDMGGGESSHESGLSPNHKHSSCKDQERSRSTSPMDLASPSPPPCRSSSLERPILSEGPSIIGAWPDSHSRSSEIASPPVMVSGDNGDNSPRSSQPIQKPMSLDAICSEPPAQRTDLVEVSGVVLAVKDPEGQVSEIAVRDQPAEQTVELQAGLKKLQTDVSRLQAHRRKYKARFNTNVHLISDKLADIDERVADVNAQYTMLLDRVDHALDIDVPDLRVQVNELFHKVDNLSRMNNESSPDSRLDAKASIETLRELVVEMRNLRESTQKQMNAELEAVRVARDAALETITSHVKEQTSTPRKRRRPDDNEVKETRTGASHIHDGYGVGASDAANVTLADIASFTTYANTLTHLLPCDHDGPPRKRARRIAKVAVQTATAVTVGALATWSALAFS